MIGAPVYERDWILPHYFEAIEKQDIPLSKIGFIFLVVERDRSTIDCLLQWHSLHPEVRCFDLIYDTDEVHRSHPEGLRTWSKSRYQSLANMRNKILDKVVCHNPDRYMSLDSDILLENPGTLRELIQLTATLDAVSPLIYMTPQGVDFPGVMTFEGDPGTKGFRANPYPIGQLFQADIIMAAVMMSRAVYQNSRYSWHRQGEDLGWATDCAHKGYKLYCASHIYAPHVMHRAMLASYLVEGDSRASLRI